MQVLDYNNYDNGLYFIDSNFEIASRAYMRQNEQDNHNLVDFLLFINESMPSCYRKNKDFILKYYCTAGPELETFKYHISWGDGKETSKELYKISDINAILKTGDIIYYKWVFFTILGRNASDVSMVNGVARANAFYFNYTENYEESSAFKLDSIKDLSSIVGNPNSYLSTVISSINGEMVEFLDDPNFKIVDKTMFQSLYKKYLEF